MSEANFTTLSYLCASLLCQVSSLTGVERIGGLHQPYTPRPSQAATKYRSPRPRAKQPPSIAPQDHAPSYSQVFALRVRSPSTEHAYTKASQRWSKWACSHTLSLSRPCRPQAPSLVSTRPSADKRPPCFPSRLRLSHQGTQTNLCVVAPFSKGQDGFCDYLYKVSTKQTPRQSSHSNAPIEGKDNTELDR